MGGSSPPLRGAETGQLLDCPPPLTARSLTRSFVILQASGPAGWGLPWPIRNRRRICVLVSGTSWNVRRGAPSGGGDPRAGRPGGRGGLAGVRASLGLRFQARRGSWGPLSRNSLPTPGWEGLSPSTRAGGLSGPSVLLSHTWQSQGSEVSLTQPHQLKLGCWGAGRGAGRGGFGSFGKNRAAGSTGLGVLDLPRARELVWGPHPPHLRREDPLPPGTGSGWRAPGLARRGAQHGSCHQLFIRTASWGQGQPPGRDLGDQLALRI